MWLFRTVEWNRDMTRCEKTAWTNEIERIHQKKKLELQFNSPLQKKLRRARHTVKYVNTHWLTSIWMMKVMWDTSSYNYPPKKMGFSEKKSDFGRGRHLLAHADWRIPHRVHSTHWQLQIVELSKASSDWSCQRNPPMRRWKIKQCQGPIPWVNEKRCLPQFLQTFILKCEAKKHKFYVIKSLLRTFSKYNRWYLVGGFRPHLKNKYIIHQIVKLDHFPRYIVVKITKHVWEKTTGYINWCLAMTCVTHEPNHPASHPTWDN